MLGLKRIDKVTTMYKLRFQWIYVCCFNKNNMEMFIVHKNEEKENDLVASFAHTELKL